MITCPGLQAPSETSNRLGGARHEKLGQAPPQKFLGGESCRFSSAAANELLFTSSPRLILVELGRRMLRNRGVYGVHMSLQHRRASRKDTLLSWVGAQASQYRPPLHTMSRTSEAARSSPPSETWEALHGEQKSPDECICSRCPERRSSERPLQGVSSATSRSCSTSSATARKLGYTCEEAVVLIGMDPLLLFRGGAKRQLTRSPKINCFFRRAESQGSRRWTPRG